MNKPQLDEILEFSSLLPSKEINSAAEHHFSFENKKLPRQVKLLIDVTNPDSIKSGSVVLDNENYEKGSLKDQIKELFWVSSPLNLVLFNPNKLSNIIQKDIDYPIELIFSYKFYLILSHSNSFVTLISFPRGISEMFNNNETEEFNFYNYTKNKKSILNANECIKVLCPVASSFHITAAQGNFVGCSDGVIRTFQIVGRPPYTNFYIKKAFCGLSPASSNIPIVSMKICRHFLYSLDAQNNLCAYYIVDKNQITPIGIPIRLPGNFINMAPFSDSVILTKQLGSNLLTATVLNSRKYFRIKKNGVIICDGINPNTYLKKYDSNHSYIYLLNIIKCDSFRELYHSNYSSTTHLNELIKNSKPKEQSKASQSKIKKGESPKFLPKLKEDEAIIALWPTESTKTSGKLVIIYLQPTYYKDWREYEKDAQNHLKFECQVNVDDIVAFVPINFKQPIPFINMNDQFLPFKTETKLSMVRFKYKKKITEKYTLRIEEVVREKDRKTGQEEEKLVNTKDETRENVKEKNMNVLVKKTIDFIIQDIDEQLNTDIEQNKKEFLNGCLCIVGDYPLCPGSNIENKFGISSVTHSTWGGFGSLFCIINSLQPNFGNLLTMQFGIKPVADIRNITGRIFAYSSIGQSDIRIISYKDINNLTTESISIFTSQGLLTVSLNKNSSYSQRIAWNTIKHIYPYWMKQSTYQNLLDFSAECRSELDNDIYPNFDNIKLIDTIKSFDNDKQAIVSPWHIGFLINDRNLLLKDIEKFKSSESQPKIEKKKLDKIEIKRQVKIDSTSLDDQFLNNFQKSLNEEKIDSLSSYINDLKNKKDKKQQKYQMDCLCTWISEEINKSSNEEYIIILSQIRDDIMTFETENFIYE